MGITDDILNGKYRDKPTFSTSKSTTKKKKKKIVDQILEGTYNPTVTPSFTVRNDDIAPVKEEERTWFKSGAFDDGYQIGDVTKTILGTTGDIGVGAVKGVGNLVEGVVDLAAYGVAGAGSLFGADTSGIKDFAKKQYVNDWLEPASEFVDRGSLLGDKADAIPEALGYVGGIIGTAGLGGLAGLGAAGTTALTTGTIGLSAMGSGMGEAYQGGATDKEAVTYGLISGIAEAGTELIFGGLGKTFKVAGLSHGLSSADDMLAKKLSSKISNQVAKNFAELGVKAAAEGSEEVMAGVIQSIGKKVTYMEEEELLQIIDDENLFEQFITGAVTSGLAQSGYIPGMTQGSIREANKTGRDFITGFTQNEQSVLDKVAENKIAEAEKDGTKLTNKEKNKIIEEVQEDLQKGLVDVADIESILGGETYTRLRNTKTEIEGIQKQVAELENKPNAEITVKEKEQLDSLREQLSTMKTTDIENQLHTEVLNKIGQDNFLQRSYYEKGQRSKAFVQEKTEKASDLAKVIYDSASRVMNNTTRSHEFVESLVKVAEDRGTKFVLVNNEQLKRHYDKTGASMIDGYVNKKGEVIINVDSPKAFIKTVGHETTHLLEGTNEYKALQDTVKEYAEIKGEYQAKVDSLTKLYQGTDANIENEITSDLVGDYLFNDADFVNHLSTKQPNVFKKIYNYIKHLVKQVTAGSKEARQLEKVKYRFEQAYRSVQKTEQNNTELNRTEQNKSTNSQVSQMHSTQGLENYTTDEIKEQSTNYIKEKLEENGIYDVIIKDSAIHGSRGRGTARTDSDLDIVVEYDGNISEDDLFNILNEEPLEIDGIKVDINPITASKTGTLKDYMERSKAYDKEVLEGKDTKYSLTDNKGRELSKEQQEYFKDSKVRDEEGNLLTMYHGTPNGSFTVFRGGSYFSSNEAYASGYQNTWASSISSGKTASNPKTYEVYLNIKNPFTLSNDIAKDIYINEYIKGGNSAYFDPYTDYTNVINNLDEIDWVEGEDLKEWLQENHPEFDGLFLDEGGDGGYGEAEYRWRGISIVPFNSNQIKSVDNTNPTDNPDIRYSLSEDSKESRLKHLNEEFELYDKAREQAYDLRDEAQKKYDDIIKTDEYKNALTYVTKNLDKKDTEEFKSHYSVLVQAQNWKNEVKQYQADVDAANNEMTRITELITNEEKEARDPKKAVRQAKKEFGITNDFKEAGYLLQDGTLLDFSGKNQGSRAIGYRTLDHRDINVVGYDMDEFIALGNVRLQPESNGFELMSEPTAKQYSALKKYIDNADGEVFIDIYKDGRMASYDSAEYKKGTPTSKIISDLQYYFKNGKFPQKSELADFLYSLSSKDNVAPRQRGLTYSEDVKIQDVIGDIEKTIDDLFDRINKIYARVTVDAEDYAPVNEANLSDLEKQYEENFKTINDDIAPVVQELDQVDEENTLDSKGITLDDKVLRDEILGLGVAKKHNSKELKQSAEELNVLISEGKTDDEALNTFVDGLGDRLLIEHDPYEYDDAVKGARDYIRTTRLYVSDEVKNGIGQWNEFRKANMGKMKLTNDPKATPVDSAYQELQELYGTNLFPEEIYNPADQLELISDLLGASKGTLTIREYLESQYGTRAWDEMKESFINRIKAKITEAARLKEAIDYADYHASIPIDESYMPDVSIGQDVDEIVPIGNNLTVKESNAIKLQNYEESLENYKQKKELSLASFNEEISNKAKEYSELKNKNTKRANSLLQQIENLKRRRDNIQVEYERKASNIAKQIERMKTPEFKEQEEKQSDLERKKARELKKLGGREDYIKNRVAELYDETKELRKGKKASYGLSRILDFAFKDIDLITKDMTPEKAKEERNRIWRDVTNSFMNIKVKPFETVNPNSQVEARIRQEIAWEYDSRLKEIEGLKDEDLKKVTHGDIQRQYVEDIKTKFTEKGYDFDKVIQNAKDKSTFSSVDNTPQRFVEKTLGYKEGQILNELTSNKTALNESEGIKWLNSFTNRKEGQLAKISKEYGIKPFSKEDKAAQMYGEGFYMADNGDIVRYGDGELAIDFPDATVQENIKKLAKDPRIRKIYDETLDMINASRERNGYEAIPRRNDYFLHFRAMEDTFSTLGLPFNPNDIRAKDLPTDLNGVTADLKPGQPYFASAKQRKGMRTSFSLLGGMEKYLNSAKNQIFHIDDIQTLRGLRNYIAETYGQAQGLENLDTLPEEEIEARIKAVYDSHLSNFAKFLNEQANVLAGKTTLIDRGLEGIIGRRGLTTLDTINSQVGKNMVGYSLSSPLTNFISSVQALAKSNKYDALKSFAQLSSNKIKSIFGKSDGFVENDPTMIRRQGIEKFHRTPYEKVSDFGYTLMSAVDDLSSEFIIRTKYNELTRKGMDSEQAHIKAGEWASRILGDRSLGQQPQLYNSKMLGLFTKFQLEVRNQLDSMVYDTIQEANVTTEQIQDQTKRNKIKAAKITSTFVQLAIFQHLFGKAVESVLGYNPAFDIISALIKTLGFDDDDESEDTILDNLSQGFLELMGDMPYSSILTGGRIPIESALPIADLVKGEDAYGNEKSRLKTVLEAAPYYVLPGGYNQIKKTAKGLAMFDDDLPTSGSYTASGNLRFPVEDTILNRIQAAAFGQYANENARDYFDNERAPLKEKQIQEYIDLDMPIKDYWEYREGLSKLDKVEEKFEYINGLDVTTEQKNIMINNVTDRKEKVDMSNYNDFGSLEEFDFANNSKTKDKYAFLQANNISYAEYDASEQTREAYNWAYNNPESYVVSKAVTDDIVLYRQYRSDLNKIRDTKDANGKTTVKAQEKKYDYIFSLDLDYGAKAILYKTEYEKAHEYNYDIIDYLNNRDDISTEEMTTILRKLGMQVDNQGNISW